jgi:predicted ATPase
MSSKKVVTTDLDPDLLLTPYRVQTNWHVLTGAACSGKTTIINMLAEKGYQTARETARIYFNQEVAKGRTLETILQDTSTERCIEEMQLQLEHELDPEDTVFLDRAIPDSISFHRLINLNPNEILSECFYHRYASIFLLDLLPLDLDDARVDEDLYRGVFDVWLERDYTALGYEVVRVPRLPPSERLAFILENISERDR